MNLLRKAFVMIATLLPLISLSHGDEIFCEKGSCPQLFTERIPWGPPPRPEPPSSRLTDQIRCERFILPYLQSIRNSEWPRITCKDIRIGKQSAKNEGGFNLREINYRGAIGRVWNRNTIAYFFPSAIFSDKLLAYTPCHIAKYPDESTDEEKIYKHPYLEEFPERKTLFACSYVLHGWGAGPVEVSYEAAPFQPDLDLASNHSHRASTFVDESFVVNGRQLVEILLRDAQDEALRKRVCREFGSQCIAPRLIKIEGNPGYDLALAYCTHEVVDQEILPPAKCLFGALRAKSTKRYFIQAMITPHTFFPSGNGVGDSDITCEKASNESLLSILKAKYPASSNFRVSETEPFRVMRLGHVSEVYPTYRENFVIRAIMYGEKGVILTPIIHFSSQNVAEQSQYRPITTIEYNFYVPRIFERLKPELVCRDARDAH